MKIGNFGRFDENLKKAGITGLTNGSKLDEDIWNEFNGRWDELAVISEQLLADLEKREIITAYKSDEIHIPSGSDKFITTKQRVGHNFFRNAVASSYNSVCCITGLANQELLIASHIKPWAESDEHEKTDPSNGLLLNALHDKAFDKGFITVTPDYVIHISQDIKDVVDGESICRFFSAYDGMHITLPDKFVPSKPYLEYHNDVIFEKWRKSCVK